MAQTNALPTWIEDHLSRYLATDGAEGHIWNGVPTLLLTTTGRKSGTARTLPLIYGRDAERYIIVASRGGSEDHPGWYKNLSANPQVQLQVGADRFLARATSAQGEERSRLWQLMAKIWPAYDDYQKKTAREIPVVLLQKL